MSDRLIIQRFEIDGESILIDQHGGVTKKVFVGDVDVTEHVRSLTIDRRTNKLLFSDHVCDDRCRCPKCGNLLYYAPRLDEHACVDPDCAWTDAGMRS